MVNLISNCPSNEDLTMFATGELPELLSDSIVDHLEECETCLQRLDSIDVPDDQLLACLRQPPAHDPIKDEPQCRQLVASATSIGHEPPSTTVAAPQPLATRQIDQYRLLGKIGEGGMGAVYKAEHVKLKKLVALKVLPQERLGNPSLVSRFEREMEAVGRLEHENIVRASDAGEAGGVHFLAMELVDGIDLSALSKLLGPMRIADACELVRQASCGLQFAHDHGIVHRDMKPSNLMLTQQGQVKILDMGLALLDTNNLATSGELTGSGQLMGTLDYMAPEQCGDSHRVDSRADIYALGATLYRLLCGEAPFAGAQYSTALKKVMAVANEEPPSILEKRSDLPDALVAILEKMMAKRPEDRYETSEQAANALQPFTEGSSLCELLAEDGVRSWLEKAESLAELSTDRFLASAYAETVTAQARRDEQPAPHPARPRITARLLGVGFAGLLALGVIIYLATNNGQLVVESDLDGIRIVVKKGDKIVDGFEVSRKGKKTKLRAGQYTIELAGADPNVIKLDRDQVTLSRGKSEIVRITRRPELAGQMRAPPLAIAPFDFQQAKKHQQAWADYLGVTVEKKIEVGQGVTLTLALIPPGELLMGYHPEVSAWVVDKSGEEWKEKIKRDVQTALPQHRVRITRPYYLGTCEVSIEQFSAFAKATGFKTDAEIGEAYGSGFDSAKREFVRSADFTWRNTGVPQKDDHPVTLLTWRDAQAFCNRLSDEGGESIRLPTEAEWEFACRAGSPMAFWSGELSGAQLVQLGNCEESLDGFEFTAPIGSFRANGFKLYDVHGNVSEWCSDWFDSEYYSHSPTSDPTGPDSGNERVIRGGSWYLTYLHANSAWRYGHTPYYAHPEVGFRVAMSLPDELLKRFGLSEVISDHNAESALSTGQLENPEQGRLPSVATELDRDAALRGAFVLLNPSENTSRKFDSLDEAAMVARGGDTIEIHGNGPFESNAILLNPQSANHVVTIRAGEGYHPVIVMSKEFAAKEPAWIQASCSLVLEGIEFQRSNAPRKTFIVQAGEQTQFLRFANCAFRISGGSDKIMVQGSRERVGATVSVRNCLMIGGSHVFFSPVAWERFEVHNSIVCGICAFSVRSQVFQLQANTIEADWGIFTGYLRIPFEPPLRGPMQVAASNNILYGRAMSISLPAPIFEREQIAAQALAPLVHDVVQWKDTNNLYGNGSFTIRWDGASDDWAVVAGMQQWKEFWDQPNASLSEGELRFVGGDVRKRRFRFREGLTTEDFRLRDDSPGFQAGPNGQDLGANVDFVGPGIAYERWKMTPEYAQWTQESARLIQRDNSND